jgi:hypothetical protein
VYRFVTELFPDVETAAFGTVPSPSIMFYLGGCEEAVCFDTLEAGILPSLVSHLVQSTVSEIDRAMQYSQR